MITWTEQKVLVSALIPYERNPRRISPAARARLKASMQEMGYHQRIIAQPDLRIIGGHQRISLLKELNILEIAVLIPNRQLTQEEFSRLLIQDNLPFGDFDFEMLGADFKMDELKAWGMPDDWAKKIPVKFDDEKAEETPALQDKIVSTSGDVWLMGGHRVMCGDSTKADEVSRLLDGNKADLVFTDPPYNVDYSGRGKNDLGKIQNDSMTTSQFDEFLFAVFACMSNAMAPLACVYVCHPDSASGPKLAFENAFALFFHKASTIIWVKQSAGMGWQDYRAQHKPILYGWKEGTGKHYFSGDRSKTTVWNIGRDAQASYQHPTQKPVALPIEAVNNSSEGGARVLDLFGGSGSTLIACEMSDRQANIMELDPKYVDLICRRYIQFTGKSAILEGDGRPFDEIEKSKG